MTAAGELLSRLEGVRRSGGGHVARCPAHADRRASLSVAEGDDGRVLVHCFAGCSAMDVVAAVGMSLADLFPRRIEAGRLSPNQRRHLTMETRVSRRWAALGAVLPELAVIEVAAAHVARQEPLNAADAARVSLAHERIHRIRLDVQEGFA